MKKNKSSLSHLVSLRWIQADDYSQWLLLWNQYCDNHLSPEVTVQTWKKLLTPDSSMKCLVAVVNEHLVGFVILVEHDCSWEIQSVCYVEDLYVEKLFRGSQYNIANQMMNFILELFHQKKWSRLYGITRVENKLAQQLYNQHATGEHYLRYVLTHQDD